MIKVLVNNRPAPLWFSGVVVLMLSACAATVPPEKAVEDRAMARWEALLSDDLAGAYEYLSPGYRSSVSSLQYQRSLLMKKVKWKDAEYLESDCVETSCKVKISLKYTVFGAIPGIKSYDGTKAIEESWVLVNGNWYLIPKN